MINSKNNNEDNGKDNSKDNEATDEEDGGLANTNEEANTHNDNNGSSAKMSNDEDGPYHASIALETPATKLGHNTTPTTPKASTTENDDPIPTTPEDIT
ncbi:hypothetical protein BDZ94DRAFT_1317687 [Collybia nuda]|uniref:Uncharacterized protein n=1 Tax=Collybia nuda TaxID=64659 RepID=A0A9P5YH11_9AGAR|nr:hypothetical protein BDZ94DRAFT_1317687 [Collybia nuda]